MRLRHYELAFSGNQQQAIQEAQTLVTNAEQQIETAVRDIDGAVKYLIDGEKQHPNRIDICKAKGSNPTQSSTNSSRQSTAFGVNTAFGKPSIPTGPSAGNSAFGNAAFGKPAAPGTGFGSPAFGQAANPTSAFGRPASGQPPSAAPAFGILTTLGQDAPAFGQPASTFGQQTPAFGNATIPAQTSNAFAQMGDSNQSSGFGRPSTSFGQPAGSAPAFGQPTAPAFSQTTHTVASQPTAAFGKPAFGAPAPRNTQPSGFGSTANAPQANSSGQIATIASNNPSAPSSQPTSTSSAFVKPMTSAASPFDTATNQKENQPFGRPDTQSTIPDQDLQVASQGVSSELLRAASKKPMIPATRDRQGKLLTWNGKPVTYVEEEPCFRGKGGAWEKIWFPDGPPVFNKMPDVALEEYDEESKESYKYMMEHGEFKDGVMPLLPPRREWCSWDF